MKIFGSTHGGRYAAQRVKKQKKPLTGLLTILIILLCLEGLYFFAVYSNNSFISYWRSAYISTAMSTMRHQWLATKLIPHDVVQHVLDKNAAAAQEMSGKETTWGKGGSGDGSGESLPGKKMETEIEEDPNVQSDPFDYGREEFYELYWELDRDTVEDYVSRNPDVLDDGWENLYINEAGLDDEGTTIYTTMGEQVLAIDVPNQILLIREEGSGYRGVLAVCKDPARLSIEVSNGISTNGRADGAFGQCAGTIAENHDGVLAMTANGFVDVDAQGNEGAGNGGLLAGYTMSNGVEYNANSHYSNFGWHSYKRLELHDDNLFYLYDPLQPVSKNCTDATEFEPAMIIDGEVLVSNWWVEINPRACIGQSDRYEILMLVIEGRHFSTGILGTDVNECSRILERHNCMQAMNVDGGASAIMWYDGEYVILNSNYVNNGIEGRPIPNAFVYHRSAVE